MSCKSSCIPSHVVILVALLGKVFGEIMVAILSTVFYCGLYSVQYCDTGSGEFFFCAQNHINLLECNSDLISHNYIGCSTLAFCMEWNIPPKENFEKMLNTTQCHRHFAINSESVLDN